MKNSLAGKVGSGLKYSLFKQDETLFIFNTRRNFKMDFILQQNSTQPHTKMLHIANTKAIINIREIEKVAVTCKCGNTYRLMQVW
ncbi:MAG: hypothetical protein APF77_21840 [Clostridia bacterium BRH_c25]|nr:MAG: hypothetical protein APF77_21840 [Clostridia bacterium BRH_c25]